MSNLIHDRVDKDGLHDVHQPDAIAKRLARQQRHSYLKDIVFGSVDGIVTTFAIVAGVAGVGADARIALILGLANLVADGFSMSAGNFLSTKTVRDEVEKARSIEEHHIDVVPDGEREEIRQIFSSKGFYGDVLEEIVRIITRNRKRWVDTMVVEEHGLSLANPSPTTAALVTFASFCTAGFLPLLPLALAAGSVGESVFVFSSLCALIGFTAIGVLKSVVLGIGMLRSLLETLILGSLASALAFLIGYLFR